MRIETIDVDSLGKIELLTGFADKRNVGGHKNTENADKSSQTKSKWSLADLLRQAVRLNASAPEMFRSSEMMSFYLFCSQHESAVENYRNRLTPLNDYFKLVKERCPHPEKPNQKTDAELRNISTRLDRLEQQLKPVIEDCRKPHENSVLQPEDLNDFKAEMRNRLVALEQLIHELIDTVKAPQNPATEVQESPPRRKHANISIRNAAYFAQVSDRTIRNWENGTHRQPPNYPGRNVDVDAFKNWAAYYRNSHLERGRQRLSRAPTYLPPGQLEQLAASEAPDHRYFDEDQNGN